MSKKVYGYIRVSTNNQVEKGMSLEDQKRQIEGYCQILGVPLDRVFTERGVSGGLPLDKRFEGNKLLSIVEEGDIIISAKLDRMFRSSYDGLRVLESLKAMKVELHFIDLGGNCTTNGVSQLIFTILTAVAEQERYRLGERIRATKQLQKKKGLYLGGKVPFGWKVEIENNERFLIEEPEQQKIIKKIKKHKKDRYSLRGISEMLEKEYGYHVLSHAGVAKVLKENELRKERSKKVKKT